MTKLSITNVSQIKSDVFSIESEGNQNPPLKTIIVNFIKSIFLKFIQMGQYFFDKLCFWKGKIQRPSSERLPASPHDISPEGKKDGNNLIEVPSSNPALAQISPLAISIIKPASSQPFDAEEPGAQAPISPLADALQINSQIEEAPQPPMSTIMQASESQPFDAEEPGAQAQIFPLAGALQKDPPIQSQIEGAVHLPMPERKEALPEAEQDRLNERNERLESRIRSPEHIKKSLEKKLKAAKHAAEFLRSHTKFEEINLLNLEIVNENSPVVSTPKNAYDYQVCHLQGRRHEQEDKHIATSINITILGQEKNATIFGICDGHGGSEAADFVTKNLPNEFQSQIELMRDVCSHSLDSKGKKIIWTPEAIIWNALKMTFVTLNKNVQCVEKMSGTTAAIAIIIEDDCWIANCGDSRIAINANGTMIAMTEDMKPDNNRKRILKRGGYVLPCGERYRLNGMLATGGAIGDHNSVGPGVSARPVITKVKLSDLPQHSELIICCDGIYDVASTQQVVNKVQELRNFPKLPKAAAIASLAYKADSEDNLSCCIVNLK